MVVWLGERHYVRDVINCSTYIYAYDVWHIHVYDFGIDSTGSYGR